MSSEDYLHMTYGGSTPGSIRFMKQEFIHLFWEEPNTELDQLMEDWAKLRRDAEENCVT
jgi:hypothetical protein